MNILFLHKSNSVYLPFSLSQVQESNPDANIVLLGDETNDKYSFIQHESILDYFESAGKFEKIYKHMSLASYQFELICFLRWFVFRDFVYEKGIEGDFVCLDSDVLVYENIELMKPFFEGYDLTVRGRGGAGFQWFRNKEVLGDFCQFIMKQYTQPELIHRLELNWIEHQKVNFGGICDMTMLNFYIDEGAAKIKDIDLPYKGLIIEKAYTDIRVCESVNGVLKIFTNDKLPFFRTLEKNSFYIGALHHNQYKSRIYKQYRGDRYQFLKYKLWVKDLLEDLKSRLIIRTRIKKLILGS